MTDGVAPRADPHPNRPPRANPHRNGTRGFTVTRCSPVGGSHSDAVGRTGATVSSLVRRRLPAFRLTVIALAACGSTPASDSSAECLPVGPSLLSQLGVPEAAAVEAGVPLGNSEITGSEEAWYVSTATGSTWVTSINPAEDQSGIIVPLNDAARTESEAGVDVSAGAPIYGDTDVDSPAARRSRTCASGAT